MVKGCGYESFGDRDVDFTGLRRSAENPIVLKELQKSVCAFLDRLLVGVENEFGTLRFVIGIINTGETLDLPGTRLLVEPLGVSLFSLFQRTAHVDFKERDVRFDVNRTDLIAINLIRADEAGDGDHPAVSK